MKTSTTAKETAARVTRLALAALVAAVPLATIGAPAQGAVVCGSNSAALLEPSGQQNWRTRQVSLMVFDQRISSALATIGELAGISVEVRADLAARLRNEGLAGPVGNILDKLADEHNLTWFFDGSHLHVAEASETEVRIIQAPGVGSREFCAALRQLDIDGDRQRVVIDERAATVLVSGLPKFATLIEGLVRADVGQIDNEITLIKGGLITRHKR